MIKHTNLIWSSLLLVTGVVSVILFGYNFFYADNRDLLAAMYFIGAILCFFFAFYIP